jgi:transcriptional regulator with XRE-family HTH domain
VDVRDVLVRARGQAGLDQRRLALKAGTARTTDVAYETGARSPTVRQLTRLLAACGLRARVVLEPLTADVDEVLDAALSGAPPAAMAALPLFAESLSAAGVRWALDGASAVAAQGLALPHLELAVALVDDEVTRTWLRLRFTEVWDEHGSSTPSWYEESDHLRRLTARPVYTVLGFLQLRLVESPPSSVLAVQTDAGVVPVLPVHEVRPAHPALDDLLRRHDERLPRTV